MAYAWRTSRQFHALRAPEPASSNLALAVSGDGRYLTYANGQPFLLNSVAAWSLIAQPSLEEATEFLDNCVTYGVNAVRVNLVEAYFVDETQFSARNISGNAAFTGTTFQSSLGAAYWAHVEAVLDAAASRGIVVGAVPAYCGNNGGGEGWWGAAVGGAPNGMKQAGTTNMQTYGANVGSVMSAHANAYMVVGGDYWCGSDTSPSSAANLAIQNAMVTGIKSTDRAGRLYTGHWSGGTNSVGTISGDPGQTWTSLNLQYDIFNDYVTTALNLDAYNFSPTTPTFFGEGIYVRNTGLTPSDLEVRAQYWRPLCWGACGQETGDEGVWPFGAATGYLGPKTWAEVQAYLGDPYWDHMALVTSVMGSRAWHLAAPDQTHVYVTSGYGTENTAGFCPVRASSALLLGYCPSGATLTIDQSKFSANIDIKKIDPTNGAVTVVASDVSNSGSAARAFTGTNAGGDPDWIAVVELHT